ncbi:MAG: chemotaxis-specific protein-glutamate methyltransferase CheB [Desulfobacteraceae bacterium]|nr:chemotaxis-specific protein-glutamate methyltransferase CheB [Desulfobacteraceae bacterium]
MIRVLVVDDSPGALRYLSGLLASDPELAVVGTARDGEEAVAAVAARKPDVVIMDILMPKMDGLQATRRIMETRPVPIVIVSSNWTAKEVDTTFRALEAGALDLVEKPPGPGHPDHERTARALLQTVKLMAAVKVVTRWPDRKKAAPAVAAKVALPRPGRMEVVAVGASTGGPLVLQTILSRLPASYPLPLLVVQHMAAGFTQGLIEWLAETSGPRLLFARPGERPRAGHVYFAPDGFFLGVDRGGAISLTPAGDIGQHRSISHLFRTVAEAYGPRAAGVLLTGMGRDGAPELKMLKERGATTIIQDEASSAVFGMPGAALELGAAGYVLPPERIARALLDLGTAAQR